MGEKVVTVNRRAHHDYHILDRIEAGIELRGTEVKSLRNGHITLKDGYGDVENGQIYLVGVHINPYEQGNIHNHDPERRRRLLLHKREILRLAVRVEEKGLTLVPLRVYFKNGLAKVEMGLCQGKHSVDKRDSIREREVKRELDRAVKRASKTHEKPAS